MSLGIETAFPPSLPLLDERGSRDSYDFAADGEKKPHAAAHIYTSFHIWSWAGQLVLFFTSITIAFRHSLGPSCVEKLSTFCKNY